MSTVTMQELELEHAELLPGRETLTVQRGFSFNPQVAVASGNNIGSGDNFALFNLGGQNANATATGNNSGAIFSL